MTRVRHLISATCAVFLFGIANANPPVAKVSDRGVAKIAVPIPSGGAFPLWYVKPAKATAETPILFVLHGVRRDADRYLGEWLGEAEANNIIVAVPEFSTDQFPGSRSYNHGNLFREDGTPNDPALWSYQLVEKSFDALVKAEDLKARNYVLFGHSAGAQFVHRLVMLGLGERMRLAITANAGSYMMPANGIDWPFGAGGKAKGLVKVESGFARPMAVLLGTADNDPAYPSLPREAEAMAQGPHRLARGLAYYAASREVARAAKVPFNWSCGLVPGVGHDNGKMAPAAILLVTGKAALKPGADCAPLAP